MSARLRHRAAVPQAVLLALLVMVGTSGCIVIPVDFSARGSRQNVDESTAAGFQPGVTTREEVLLQLGEPDVVSGDQRSLGYAWSRIKFVWVVGSYGGGAAGNVAKRSFLRLDFDESGRFICAEITGDWESTAAR